MKHIKYFPLILALLLAIGIFSACSKFEYDNSTVIAKVESISGQKVVLLVGEMNIGEGMSPENFGGEMGNVPNFNGGEMPNIEGLPNGEFPSDFGGMQIPDGEISEGFDSMQLPDREIPEGFEGMQIPNGQFPSSFADMQIPFNENGDKITLTLNEEIVKTLSVGSIVQITFGDNGSVEALTAIEDMMSNFGGNGYNNFMPSEGNQTTYNPGS